MALHQQQPPLSDIAAPVHPPAHLRDLPKPMRDAIQAASLAAHLADPPPPIDGETLARLRALVRESRRATFQMPRPRTSSVGRGSAVEPSNLDRARVES